MMREGGHLRDHRAMAVSYETKYRATVGMCYLMLSLAPSILDGFNLLGWGRESVLPTVCVFKLVAGVDCPACGITRSAALVGRGQWEQSARQHPLGGLAVLLSGGIAIYGLIAATAGARWPVSLSSEVRWCRLLTWMFGVALLVVWVLRVGLQVRF